MAIRALLASRWRGNASAARRLFPSSPSQASSSHPDTGCRPALTRNTPSSWQAALTAAGLAAATTTATFCLWLGSENEEDSGRPLTRYAISEVAERIIPSVVNIVHRYPFDGYGLGTVKSNGSGFIIDDSGIIVTNAHVVVPTHVDAAGGDLLVTLSDGKRLHGRVHSFDRQSDIALVTVEAPYKLPVATLGDSSKLRTGEFVVAVGSPMSLTNSVTCGIISSPARLGSEFGMTTRTEYLQTDAAINSGNSGGPLVNLDGEVIGINTLKLEAADSIGFAIPVDVARRIIGQLRAQGRVVRPYLGIRLATVERATIDPEYKRRRESSGHRRGYATFPAVEEDSAVLVIHVAPGSPAARAGLRPNDLIVRFDGRDAHMTTDVLNRIGLEVGRDIEIVVRREGSGEIVLTVRTEGEQPKEAETFRWRR